jgi:murein L,D-transpeptidase YafK
MSQPKRRRRRRRIMRTLAVLLLAMIGIAVLFISPIPERSFERNIISFKRHFHKTMFELGLELPRTPDTAKLKERLAAHNVRLGAPIFMRVFKQEFELELWMLRDGRFHHFATYPICSWSGNLGPKYREGDRQSPEGFYTVAKSSLNPNSRWRRSFNLGFPNRFDRAHGRTGSFLMVHGGCSSVGCYAMTDPVIDEIWAIVTAALNNGQKRFQVQAFPFRMSDKALAQHSEHPNFEFWSSLKDGFDHFEEAWMPPRVSVCNSTYQFSDAQTSNGSDPISSACVGT